MNYFHNETEIVMFGLFACDNDKDENEKQELMNVLDEIKKSGVFNK